ncbi:MAG: DUF3726 domain-containing protein [Kiloniellales bacterium]
MIVTLNEVEQWCLRALAGAGTPAGIDEDAAWSAGWLVARGFPALELLVAALDRCPDAAAAARVSGTDAQTFDAGSRSAIFLAGGLIDSAVAAAASGAVPARISVAALADPLFLLPIAERHRRRGWCFQLQWRGAAAGLDGNGPRLLGEPSAFLSAIAVETSIACARQPLADMHLPVTLRPSDLDDRYAATLDKGVAVANETWTRLKTLGMRALVPASEESRTRGAGSAASDNE